MSDQNLPLDDRVSELLSAMEALFRGKEHLTPDEYQARAQQLADQARALVDEIEK